MLRKPEYGLSESMSLGTPMLNVFVPAAAVPPVAPGVGDDDPLSATAVPDIRASMAETATPATAARRSLRRLRFPPLAGAVLLIGSSVNERVRPATLPGMPNDSAVPP